MKKHEAFKDSVKRFSEQQKVNGFCNWQKFTDKFLLECWMVLNKKTGKYNLAIVQFWANGKGYEIFWQEEN